jgi:hypothetical protein
MYAGDCAWVRRRQVEHMNWLAVQVGEPWMEAQRQAMYERVVECIWSWTGDIGTGGVGTLHYKDQMCPCLLLTSCALTLKKASPDVIVSSFRNYVFLKHTTSKVAI